MQNSLGKIGAAGEWTPVSLVVTGSAWEYVDSSLTSTCGSIYSRFLPARGLWLCKFRLALSFRLTFLVCILGLINSSMDYFSFFHI